jgi:nitroimidazol reductase NimA-like FMN-containing flavoprotein (pyridoxamine 5'-phosphate oxidase superfamily)
MERSETDLSPAACWELLPTAGVGHLALSSKALPTIRPVRYVVDDGEVVIGLGCSGMPAAAVDNAVIAFAVDRIDDESGTGWIVQMQGRARLAPTGTASDGPGSFDPGQVVRLVPGAVAGHRFTLQPLVPVR